MASGGEKGTNGWPRVEWGPLLVIAAVGFVVGIVNATSRLMEARRDGRLLEIWAPFTWELSSAGVLVLLAPAIGYALQRLPPRRDRLIPFLFGHAALTLPFCFGTLAFGSWSYVKSAAGRARRSRNGSG